MNRRSLIVILMLYHVACHNEQSTQPGPVTPYELWKSYNIHNYTIDQIRICYCVHSGEMMKIVIRSDTMMSMIRLSDSTTISSATSLEYLTIDSLFGMIRNAEADSLVIIYNSRYGYPEKLDINPQLHPRDGGVLYETSNLHIP